MIPFNIIIESGFTQAFMEMYCEDKLEVKYPEEDRLDFMLSSNEIEKTEIINKKIFEVKNKIKLINLKNEELSIEFLASLKENNLKYDYNFWFNKFHNSLLKEIKTFTPIGNYLYTAQEKLGRKSSNGEVNLNYLKNRFWLVYYDPKPESDDLIDIIYWEGVLMVELEAAVDQFYDIRWWVFEINDFEKYIKYSKPIELLFQYSELFVQLIRLADYQQLISGAASANQTEVKENKLNCGQIALIHVYNEIQITRDNADKIAAKYGYTAKSSGEGLYQDYTKYSSSANRKGRPYPSTKKKFQNKINLLKSTIEYLTDKGKKRVLDEIKILETLFENEHS